MFRPMPDAASSPLVSITVDGRPVEARKGVSVAMALMEAALVPLRRTPLSGAPRAPLCLMGICFECLCEVDGQQNVQSCMVEVAEGMRIQRATGARRMEGCS